MVLQNNYDIDKPIRKFPKISVTVTIVFFISILLLCATFSNFDDDDYTWKCPSCPRRLLNFTDLPSTSTSPTNISHLVFGVAASAATWRKRSRYVTLWWDPDTMRGSIWLDREAEGDDNARYLPVKVSSVDFSKFKNRAVPSRIAHIVVDAYNRRQDDARWLVIGDDDTIFFKENLISMLNKYNHNEMYYIGAPSESVEQNTMHSYKMAYGGGGFAVSIRAARELAGTMEGCLERYVGFYGSDQRVYACFAEIGVPLTMEPGFHQMDVRGNVYGLLAAHPVAPLISLHHLDSIEPIFPTAQTQLDAIKTLLDASKPDQARTLQQTICYVPSQTFSWSVSVSWGYTVQIYPYILPPNQLEVPLQTFFTWRTFKDGPFLFNTRSVRLDKECEIPVLFFLKHFHVSNEGEANSTVTEYLRYTPKNGKVCKLAKFKGANKVDLVRVMANKMDPDAWLKAPRRQCCETRRLSRGRILEVKIRDCYRGEITSPP